ncbi:hypothetical protein V565_205240, partial [Rhizoctonia solani 123E]
MGISAHSRWGPPLEQYVLRYNKASVHCREVVKDDTMCSAQQCMQSIATLSKEADDIKFGLLAKKVTLEMLRCLFLLSLSGQGILYLAQPPLIRGCIKLMTTITVDGMISPFSYEYGYLCFNIAKTALGVCLLDKFNEQWVTDLMEQIRVNYLTKDNPSILTDFLSLRFVTEGRKSSPPTKVWFDWVFGWAEPPAHCGRSELLVFESDVLVLMNVLWEDRKSFLKSLLSTYTPGTSIISMLIWQYMIRNGELSKPLPRTSHLELFLDLTWRFALAATPSDYGLIVDPTNGTIVHLGDLARSVVDVEDSRAVVTAYIKGILPDESKHMALYRSTAIRVYPHLFHFVIVNAIPGTEDLFPPLVGLMLSRTWEMISWAWEGTKPTVGILCLCFQDLQYIIQNHIRRPVQSQAIQALREETVKHDVLGLAGSAINLLIPNGQEEALRGKAYCTEVSKIITSVLSIIVKLGQASSSSIIHSYFYDYQAEWVKHLHYNDILMQMAGNFEAAKSCAKFRRDLLW